jgi:hypothetical protein
MSGSNNRSLAFLFGLDVVFTSYEALRDELRRTGVPMIDPQRNASTGVPHAMASILRAFFRSMAPSTRSSACSWQSARRPAKANRR